MLRPATPLSILLFVAFVLLLLSVISTPIVKSIPLATFHGVDYGVFGYCSNNKCSGIKIGYSTLANGNDFSLPSSTRHSLSTLLVVHPVAAFLTLICLVLSLTAHLHSPSHSPRYLLALIILLLPTLLITLLAFLVDILLFVPHLQWGGWIVLAATILIVASGVVTCAMRRTLVSRKARKKRIAENAEMSGENFYNQQNAVKNEFAPPPLSQQPTTPMVNGAPGADKLPAFAVFDASKSRTSEDDRTPLNTRTPSSRTAVPSSTGYMPGLQEDGMDRYGGAARGGGFSGVRGGRGGGPYRGPRDEFGNPLPPSGAFGAGPLPQPGARRNSQDSFNSQASRGRGRGGYPPRGYGRGGPYNGGRGGPQGYNGNGRGIPLGVMAAGAGAGAGAVDAYGNRPPPPGYANGYPPQGSGGPGQYQEMPPAEYGQSGPYGRRQSPGPPSAPGYGRRQSPGPPSAPGYGRRQSPGPPSDPGYGYGAREQIPGGGQGYVRHDPPPPLPLHQQDGMSVPIGQAVEMDATTGSPNQRHDFEPFRPLRDSDSDVQGLVGLQQNRGFATQEENLISPTSVYSAPENTFVPARSAWAGGIARNNTPPLQQQSAYLIEQTPSITPPVELSATNSVLGTPPSHYAQPSQPTVQVQNSSPTHARARSGDNYYEDVDPRFAELSPETQSVPALLLPGHQGSPQIQQQPYSHPIIDRERLNSESGPGGQGNLTSSFEPTSSYESIQEGSRSPAASDGSHFTSISQRGVNPDWRPPPGPEPQQSYRPIGPSSLGQGSAIPNRRPVQQQVQAQRDVLLQGNPDFELPGARAGNRRPGGGGRPYVGSAL